LPLKSRQIYDDKAKAEARKHLAALGDGVAGSATLGSGNPDREAAKANEPSKAERPMSSP